MGLYCRYIDTRFRVNLINCFLKITFVEIVYIIINYIKIILYFYKSWARCIYREMKFRSQLIRLKKIFKSRRLIKNRSIIITLIFSFIINILRELIR